MGQSRLSQLNNIWRLRASALRTPLFVIFGTCPACRPPRCQRGPLGDCFPPFQFLSSPKVTIEQAMTVASHHHLLDPPVCFDESLMRQCRAMHEVTNWQQHPTDHHTSPPPPIGRAIHHHSAQMCARSPARAPRSKPTASRLLFTWRRFGVAAAAALSSKFLLNLAGNIPVVH